MKKFVFRPDTFPCGRVTHSLHSGHEIEPGFSDEFRSFSKHGEQYVCTQGRIFGCSYISKQILHVRKLSRIVVVSGVSCFDAMSNFRILYTESKGIV